MIKFHYIDSTLQCKKYTLLFNTLQYFRKKNCCIIFPLLDYKNSYKKKIYRWCIGIYKYFNTGYHTNPLQLTLKVVNLFGKMYINDEQIKNFKLYTFKYSEPIKFDSQFSITSLLLLR